MNSKVEKDALAVKTVKLILYFNGKHNNSRYMYVVLIVNQHYTTLTNLSIKYLVMYNVYTGVGGIR